MGDVGASAVAPRDSGDKALRSQAREPPARHHRGPLYFHVPTAEVVGPPPQLAPLLLPPPTQDLHDGVHGCGRSGRRKQHDTRNCRLIDKIADLERFRKSCWLGRTNYLRPDLKRREFTDAEGQTILNVHCVVVGNRWSVITAQLRPPPPPPTLQLKVCVMNKPWKLWERSRQQSDAFTSCPAEKDSTHWRGFSYPLMFGLTRLQNCSLHVYLFRIHA